MLKSALISAQKRVKNRKKRRKWDEFLTKQAKIMLKTDLFEAATLYTFIVYVRAHSIRQLLS